MGSHYNLSELASIVIAAQRATEMCWLRGKPHRTLLFVNHSIYILDSCLPSTS